MVNKEKENTMAMTQRDNEVFIKNVLTHSRSDSHAAQLINDHSKGNVSVDELVQMVDGLGYTEVSAIIKELNKPLYLSIIERIMVGIG